MATFRLGARILKLSHKQPTRTLFSSTKTAPPRSPILTGFYRTFFVLGTGLFAVYYFDARSAVHRYFLTPALRYTLDAETGHKVAVKVLRSGLGPKDPVTDDEKLTFELWGQKITNPVGLAAGFDKDGEAIDGLFDLGFSWVEIGSVTPKPQTGNPRPRVFHLPEDSALINRYGFPSQGHASVLSRLRARIPSFFSADPSHSTSSLRQGALLAVNLGKNKTSAPESIEDFVLGVRALGPYSDVLVVNVSSPNTPGLRGLQNRELLERLLTGVTAARDNLPPSEITARKPRLVLKIAPDLDEAQLVEMASVIRSTGIDGVIVSNTTTQRPASLMNDNKAEIGGLSGVPLKNLSLTALRTLRSHLPSSISLIGCGGIFTGADAIEYAKAGASLVQIYTGFGYDGAGACRRIKDQVVESLEKEGKTWAELVNTAVEQLSAKPESKPLPVPDKIAPGEGSLRTLIEEAEELKKLLDKLGESMGGNEAVEASGPAIMANVS